MTVFAVMGIGDAAELGSRVEQQFPHDHYNLGENKWLIAASGETAKSISEKLNLVKGVVAQPLAMIINMGAGYYGLAPADIWEWIAVKATAVAVHA